MINLMSRQGARYGAYLGSALLATQLSYAQTPVSPEVLDDFTERSVVAERQVLAYPPVREADILWERRIWRIVDVREKLNLPFIAPEAPLFKILANAVESGELIAYSAEDDRFTTAMTPEDVSTTLNKTDTILITDILTGDEKVQVVVNNYNWEDVKRFRLKEAWYFDARTSTLKVRILGIAPLLDVKDENGEFRFEQPLFWIHYPSARTVLAQHKVALHGGNLAATATWEDIMETRRFASAITKENNVRDNRLSDMYTGRDLLMQSDRIKNELFNFEQDLWSY